MFKSFNLNTIIFFTILTLLFNGLYFSDFIMPLHWLLTGGILFIILFSSFYVLNNKWGKLNSKAFLQRITFTSIVTNLISVGFIYFICYLYNGTFFEPSAADSLIYHEHGVDLANNFRHGDFNISNYLSDNDYSDYGYNVFLGIVYFIFGPYTLVARIFNAIFMTLSVRAVFQISEIVYDQKIAKTASLITAFSPFLLFYIGVNLKESFMIYALLLAVLQSIRILLLHNNNLKNYSLLILSIILLFFFRTVLGMVFFVSFISFYYLNTTIKKNIYKIFALFGLLLSISFVAYYLNSIGITQKVIDTFFQSNTQTDAELADKISKGSGSGLSLNKALIIPLLFVSVMTAPFSTLVFLDEQVEIAWLFPGALMKNILVFFSFIGLWYSAKYLFRRSSLIIAILIGYLIVIAVSAQSTSIRYQLVALPFINIFAAFGLHQFNIKKKYYWLLYLFLMFLAIFAWNYFKLSIRNLI